MIAGSADDTLDRIRRALDAALEVLTPFTPGSVAFHDKGGGDPLTDADHAVNDVLRSLLPHGDEGWLSEETVDDAERLGRSRVWVVDPLDGTREFVAGIPEWCVSIGLVEDGEAVAGGVANPQTGEIVVGAVTLGVTYNGTPAQISRRDAVTGATVLASRSEVKRGEWEHLAGAPFTVRAMGSVAYKLALVAAGQADATWTVVPKNEWDVAAGTALVLAAGGTVYTLDGQRPRFNNPSPLLRGLVAHGPHLRVEVEAEVTRAAALRAERKAAEKGGTA